MKKFTLLAVLAAMFIPLLSNAQSTDCTDYTSVPYSTGFEGISTGVLPSCWVQYQTSAGYEGVMFPYAYNYAGNARNGSVYFEFETHNGQNEVVAMPLMQNISSLKLTFWASAQSYYLPVRFEVGVMEETSTDTLFVPVDTITFTTSSNWGNGYHQYTVYFTNYNGSGERIAFRATGSGSGSYTLMMDDFSVALADVPEVSLPASASTNINTDLTITATVLGPTDGVNYTWTSLMYDASNATMSSLDNVLTINYTTSGIDTVSLIVSNASGADTATMVIRVMDLSPITELPYSTGFESGQDLNWNFVNGANAWYIDTATNNGGNNAMYISNDNGTSNTYSTTTSSTSYAYRYVQLDAGEYVYSFDWRCAGESGWGSNNYDYLRFYLAANDADFSGTTVSTTGWNNLSDDLLGQSSWQTATGTFTVTTSGLYPIVFCWVNDYTSGSQPPAAIDNFYLNALSCPAITNLSVDDSSITSDGATITWNTLGEETAWWVKVDSTEIGLVYDSSYTFTGLDPMTQHIVYVAAYCGSDTSLVSTTSFVTDCANGSCNLDVAMQDTYGDGWNGARLNFYQNGTLRNYAQLSNGNNATAQVSVCSGMPVVFSWQSGSYDSECSYTIYDGSGAEVYSSATSGVNHSDTIANACPSCATPSGVHATSVDSASITFVWTEDPNVSEYIISFNGAAYTTGYYGTETYSGLSANTSYTFSVRAVCQAGVDTSAARTITVKTSCGPMTLPLVEGFEAETPNAAPMCWDIISGTPLVVSNSSNAHTGSNSLLLEQNDMLATSEVPLAGDSIKVSFWANFYGGTLEAGVMTNVLFDSTFIPLLTLTTSSGYELFEFNTATLPHDSSYHVAFRFTTAYSYMTANIDDINITEDEGCMHPSALVATPVTNGVNLSWNYTGTTNTFAIEYRSDNGAWSAPESATTTTASLSGLDASTSYEVRVGAICGTDTLWTTTTFQTPCGLMPIPYAENFDAYANDVMPPCWEWNISFATHWDGGVFLKSYHGGGSEYVVLPQLDGTITKLKVEFDTKVGTPTENDGILIGVADAAGTLLAWLDTIQDVNFSRNNHVRKTIYFPNYTNIPVGAARVAFAQYRNWGEWALIDNINIEELPSCYPVDNLVGHNLDDIENTTFTWHPMGAEAEWEIYVDTVTVGIDSLYTLPDSLFTTVYDTSYTLPIGAVQGGGIYNFFVRAKCDPQISNWVKVEFGAGTIIMNQATDTITGCGFVVYDNGGPIAGYLANSSNELIIRTENAGSQVEIFGGKFGFGSSQATLTVYDGEGTSGTVLYTYNTIDGRDTLLNTILATSTTGSLTITFVSSGTMCHTGYELYVRCTDGALCPRPTQLQATMTSASEATATWEGTANNYNFYYRLHNAATWVRIPTTTNSVALMGLMADTIYDMYVMAICSATDSSSASATRQLHTSWEDPQPVCDPVTDVTVSDITTTTATIAWTAPAGQSRWEIDYGATTIEVTANPHTLTGLSDSTAYTVKVRALCGNEGLASEWSGTASFTTLHQHEGIDDVNASHIALFPNPASATVTLTGIEGQATVTVVDMNGRIVVSEANGNSGRWTVNNGELTIDVSNLAQGAYFVRIVGEQVNAIRKLIVR